MKKKILNAFLKKLEKRREVTKQSMLRAHEDANEAESAMQTRYGSAKEENQLLAQAFQERLFKIEREISYVRQVVLNFKEREFLSITEGTLVKVEVLGDEKYFFLFSLGGEKVNIEGKEVTIVSKEAPLFHLLRGRKVGDKCILPNGNELRIISFS